MVLSRGSARRLRDPARDAVNPRETAAPAPPLGALLAGHWRSWGCRSLAWL